MATKSANQILVPIDFSGQSIIALEQSYNLARLSKSEITLLHVIEGDPKNPISKLLKSKQVKDKAEKAALSKLDAIAKKAQKDSNVVVNTMVDHGKIYEQIVKVARKLKALFLIMGTNESGIIKQFIGSNTLRVVREAPCPVITIRGTFHRQGCKNIVLPLDLTKQTKQKVRFAVQLANYFGSAIKVVSVLTTNDEFIVNKLRRQIEQVRTIIEKEGIDCTAELIEGGNIAKAIIDYGKKAKADLIMIMTQQEKDFTDYFIGSSAQQIINHSDIPVISIRPEEVHTFVDIPSALY